VRSFGVLAMPILRGGVNNTAEASQGPFVEKVHRVERDSAGLLERWPGQPPLKWSALWYGF
jgi:hypothetical protein